MSLPRYPEHKDSGVDWLGQVPAHWQVQPLKRRYAVVGGSTPKSDVPEYWDGDINWVTPADLSRLSGFEIRGSLRTITDVGLQSCGTSLVPSGSLILSTRAPIGSLGLATIEVCTNQGCKALVPQSGELSRFAAYALSIAGPALNVRGKGTTFLELSGDELASFRLAFPETEEQRAITTFLDQETAKIDALIAEQEELLALLAEKRQATISHAVTRGLDPNAPMKDSGIPWLGEVPAHWQIANIKRLCELITDGAHVSPETEDGTFCFVSTKDVGRDGIDFEGCLLTSEASYEYLVKTGCQPLVGDVLFSKDGTVGRTTVVRDKKEFVVASSLIIIRPMGGRLDPNFLDYLCQSRLVKNQVEGFVKGAGLPRLSIQNLLKVVGVFPPLSEQRRISGFLAECLERSDRLENEVLHAVSTLKERRSALIAAAVTGQIDVRGLVEAQAA